MLLATKFNFNEGNKNERGNSEVEDSYLFELKIKQQPEMIHQFLKLKRYTNCTKKWIN